MYSNGKIVVNNLKGTFFINGLDSKLISDEIFISGATVEDVEIIPSISQGNLKATGTVVTSAVESATTVTATSECITGPIKGSRQKGKGRDRNTSAPARHTSCPNHLPVLPFPEWPEQHHRPLNVLGHG